MKIQIMSDLHSEFFEEDELKEFLFSLLPENPVDTLILAGDIGVPAVAKEKFEICIDFFCKNYKKVLYVAGNHEYYSSNFKRTDNYINSLSNRNDNFHFLNDKVLTINNIRFIGSTLWFAYDVNNVLYTRLLNDFVFIKQYLEDFEKKGKECIEFINTSCLLDKYNIVITHHLPSKEAIPEIFKTSKINRFFVNDLAEETIYNKNPYLWIFGHTHSSCDLMIEKTRILCNSWGYIRHEHSQNKIFNKGLILDV